MVKTLSVLVIGSGVIGLIGAITGEPAEELRFDPRLAGSEAFIRTMKANEGVPPFAGWIAGAAEESNHDGYREFLGSTGYPRAALLLDSFRETEPSSAERFISDLEALNRRDPGYPFSCNTLSFGETVPFTKSPDGLVRGFLRLYRHDRDDAEWNEALQSRRLDIEEEVLNGLLDCERLAEWAAVVLSLDGAKGVPKDQSSTELAFRLFLELSLGNSSSSLVIGRPSAVLFMAGYVGRKGKVEMASGLIDVALLLADNGETTGRFRQTQFRDEARAVREGLGTVPDEG
jgi:hypothetical protein